MTVLDEKIARIIGKIATIESLAQFEKNAARRDALSSDVREAIAVRTT
jgi:hypothetical protein